MVKFVPMTTTFRSRHEGAEVNASFNIQRFLAYCPNKKSKGDTLALTNTTDINRLSHIELASI